MNAPVTALAIANATPENLEAARALKEEAAQAITAARERLAAARERFLRDPNPENDEAVETAARAERTAERMSDARVFQFESAAELLAAAERERAQLDLEQAGEIRERIITLLGEQFETLAAHARAANQAVALIADLVHRDSVACKQANQAAQRARVPGTAKPIELDTVRRAFAILLAAGRRAPRAQVRRDDATRLQGLINLFGRNDLSIEQQIELLHMAMLEVAQLTEENDLGAWLTPHYAPSAIHKGADTDLRHGRARRLLLAIPTETAK